jgi:hypothetical protein
VESGVDGHVLALEPSSAKMQGPKLRDTWQLVVACPTLCLGFKPVCGVPGLQGTDINQSLSMQIVVSNLSRWMHPLPRPKLPSRLPRHDPLHPQKAP